MKQTTTEDIKRRLKASIRALGAIAVGVADASEIDTEEQQRFRRWLDEGNAQNMAWLERHEALRADPRLLLPDAKSVVSIAFSYRQPRLRNKSLPSISTYAYGKDYHDVLRKKLKPICRELEEATGCATRICVDSAPIAERYWALKGGIGRRGDNGAVIIDGFGSYLFLCEILTTLQLPADEPSSLGCLHCGRCAAICPGKALQGDGTIRPGSCLSYLTIEHHGDFPAGTASTPQGRATLYGCDLCQDVCPYNQQADAAQTARLTLPEFLPRHESILSLTTKEARSMTAEEWRSFNQGSAMKRAKPEQMMRNAANLTNNDL